MQCGGVRAGVIPLCSALVRQLLRNCAQVPRFRREIDQLKTVQARATNTVGKLKREIYTETLKELIIWPGEEKVKRASDLLPQVLRRGYGETRSSHSWATKGLKAAVTSSREVGVKKKISRCCKKKPFS